MQLGKRVCVVGTSGSGKSYVAKAISTKLGLRYIESDALIWGPDWFEVPRQDRLSKFEAATRDGGWVIDSNLGSSPEDQIVLERLDTIMWLDLPRREVWWQVTRRTLARVLFRQRIFQGNVESWRMMFSRDSIIWWSIKTYGRRRRQYGALFRESAFAQVTKVRLRSRREVDEWLAGLS